MIPGKLRHRTGKEGEAPIFIFTAIDALRIEDWMAHQVERQAILRVPGFIDGEIGAHGVGAPDGLGRNVETAPEPAIARHDQAHVMAEGLQGWRE